MANIRREFGDDLTLKNGNLGINTTTAQERVDVVGVVKGTDLNVTGVSSLTAYEGFLRADNQIVEETNLEFGNGLKASLSGEIIVGTGVTVTIGAVGLGTTSVGVGTHTIQSNIDTTDINLAGGSQIECLKVYNTFTPPSGGTNERPYAPKPGELYYNYDFKTIEFFDGYGWRQVDNTTTAGRMVTFGGTFDYPATDTAQTIDYLNIHTFGNAQYFGDLTAARGQTSACSSATRGLCMGGNYPANNIIEYVTIAAGGNSIDFGDCNRDVQYGLGGCSSSTRGFAAGGYDTTPAPGADLNTIDYVEISTLGNMQDFGDLTTANRYGPSFSSPVRGFYIADREINVWTMASKGNSIDWGDSTDSSSQLGGSSNSVRGVYLVNGDDGVMTTIDQVSLSSLGNAIYFGDLGRSTGADVASGATQTRAIFAGGFASPAVTNMNNIDYVTIMTAGNAQDFGDIAGKGAGKSLYRGCSDSHGGLGGF